ncbi:MAG: hypothetical protein QW726_05855 [Fervidicoccaceae archaeon]
MRVSISRIEENDKKIWRVTAYDCMSRKFVYECEEIEKDNVSVDEAFKSIKLDYIAEIAPEDIENVSYDKETNTYSYKAKKVYIYTVAFLIAGRFVSFNHDYNYLLRVKVVK